jgi:hypothetical protein
MALPWQQRHHTLLQGLLSRGPLPEPQFQAIFADVSGRDPGTLLCITSLSAPPPLLLLHSSLLSGPVRTVLSENQQNAPLPTFFSCGTSILLRFFFPVISTFFKAMFFRATLLFRNLDFFLSIIEKGCLFEHPGGADTFFFRIMFSSHSPAAVQRHAS